MLQYLINATAVWLISLLVYDLFLRRESYHGYNRFYLLGTFIMGAFLPLWRWPDDSFIIRSGSLEKPVDRMMHARQQIIDTTTTAMGRSLSWQQWLLIIYIAGAFVALGLLCLDIIKIAAYRRSGIVSRQGNWTVVETGKGHPPFSFMHLLFVNSMAQYSSEEWAMILHHEQRHTQLMHLADVVLMQLARIVFWFHPLVYVYNKRLLLVHEYQADHAYAQQSQRYGRFLLGQALLPSAPALSHSFNRSPIKKRILMLTRTSSVIARVKMLLFIPLAFISFVCCTQNSFSQKFIKNGNMVTYRGNRFELSKPMTDTMVVVDPVTGKEVTKLITHDPYPIKMNGEKIYTDDDLLNNPNRKAGDPVNIQPGIDDNSAREYLLSNLKKELTGLPDGQYIIHVSDLVIDRQGKIVYFTNDGITPYGQNVHIDGTKPFKLDEKIKEAISKKINELLDGAPLHSPAIYKGGSPVPYLLNGASFWNPFTIKNGIITAE